MWHELGRSPLDKLSRREAILGDDQIDPIELPSATEPRENLVLMHCLMSPVGFSVREVQGRMHLGFEFMITA